MPVSRLQVAGFLGGLDDAQRQAILDRAQRIERLDLDVEVDPARGEIVDADDRRVADGLEDAAEFRHVDLTMRRMNVDVARSVPA